MDVAHEVSKLHVQVKQIVVLLSLLQQEPYRKWLSHQRHRSIQAWLLAKLLKIHETVSFWSVEKQKQITTDGFILEMATLSLAKYRPYLYILV